MDQRDLDEAEQRAAAFDRLRRDHQTETAEDYVEMIADLIDATGEARLVDLAARFGVAHPTANKVVARLQREGLVATKPYRAIFLTEAGRQMAAMARHRHRVVVECLKAIGVSAPTAELDAEGIEHHLSAESLAAFERWLTRLQPGKA